MAPGNQERSAPIRANASVVSPSDYTNESPFYTQLS